MFLVFHLFDAGDAMLYATVWQCMLMKSLSLCVGNFKELQIHPMDGVFVNFIFSLQIEKSCQTFRIQQTNKKLYGFLHCFQGTLGVIMLLSTIELNDGKNRWISDVTNWFDKWKIFMI